MVFSNPDTVRRVNRDFIPVALKAATVDNPPAGPEGDLYRVINRTRAVPQGICTLNSSGSVLAWALSFQHEEHIPKFLDYVLARYVASPAQPIDAERFQTFPTRKLADVPAIALPILPARHTADQFCVGAPPVSDGELSGTIIGRRLDENSDYVADSRRQENFMEARVTFNRQFQTQLVELAQQSGFESFDLPDDLCRAIGSPAFLGQLDVNPLGVRPGGNENRHAEFQFSAQRSEMKTDGTDSFLLRLEGTSHVEGGERQEPNGPTWDHVVKLKWQGFATVTSRSVTKLCLFASGSEKLTWGNRNLRNTKERESAHLMAGHLIDVDSMVQYGLHAAKKP